MKYKRIGAYLIDYLFLSMILVLVAQLKIINPYYDEYIENYEKYEELLEKENIENLANIYKDEKYMVYYQNVSKYGAFISGVFTLCYLFYFVGFQKWNKDQSLGKKIMKLKVVDKEGNSPSVFKYIIRTMLIYNLFVSIIIISLAFVLGAKEYLYSSMIINVLGYVFLYSNFIVYIFRKDNKGIHDLIVGTSVMEVENVNK